MLNKDHLYKPGNFYMLVVQITWLVCVMLSLIKPYMCICEACSYNQACMSVTYQSMVFTHGCGMVHVRDSHYKHVRLTRLVCVSA